MFYSKGISNLINTIHKRTMRLHLLEDMGFEDLLQKDKYVTIHKSTLQNLATEAFNSLNQLKGHPSCVTFSIEQRFNLTYKKDNLFKLCFKMSCQCNTLALCIKEFPNFKNLKTFKH